MKPRIAETEVARSIITYLIDLRWEVFQEVTGMGGRADIVARQGKIIWVIETKVALGLPIIEQAYRWSQHAHLVSVGTPSYPKEFARKVCDMFGIGILSASGPYSDGSGTKEHIRPRLNRKPYKLPHLCDEHKTYAEAGTNGGGYFTPFRRTMKAVEEEVRRHPGISIKELVDRVDHHYHRDTTARQCLAKWIIAGELPGYGIRLEGKKNIVVRVEA